MIFLSVSRSYLLSLISPYPPSVLSDTYPIPPQRLTLQNLSKEFTTTYDRIMHRIWNPSENDIELIKNIFTWILHSFRSLKVVELQHALTIHSETKKLNEKALIDEELLLSVCGDIIIVDHESKIIRLVHYTAQKYFQRTKIKTFSATQNTIAKMCLD